jgi:hypothetical protein
VRVGERERSGDKAHGGTHARMYTNVYMHMRMRTGLGLGIKI